MKILEFMLIFMLTLTLIGILIFFIGNFINTQKINTEHKMNKPVITENEDYYIVEISWYPYYLERNGTFTDLLDCSVVETTCITNGVVISKPSNSRFIYSVKIRKTDDDTQLYIYNHNIPYAIN